MDAAATSTDFGGLGRYYEIKTVGHQRVCAAPNHVCAIFLAAEHPCFENGRRVTRVALRPHLGAPVSGKKKRGAVAVRADEEVGVVECEDGARFPVVAGVAGKVLERNDGLSDAALRGRAGYLLLIEAAARDVDRLFGREPRRKPCFAWQKGACQRGAGCHFAHGDAGD